MISSRFFFGIFLSILACDFFDTSYASFFRFSRRGEILPSFVHQKERFEMNFPKEKLWFFDNLQKLITRLSLLLILPLRGMIIAWIKQMIGQQKALGILFVLAVTSLIVSFITMFVILINRGGALLSALLNIRNIMKCSQNLSILCFQICFLH